MKVLSPVWRMLVLLAGLVLLAVPGAVREGVFRAAGKLPAWPGGRKASDEIERMRRDVRDLSIGRARERRIADAAERFEEFRVIRAELGDGVWAWFAGIVCGARFGPGGDRYLVASIGGEDVRKGLGVVKGYAAFGTVVDETGGRGWVLPLDEPPSRVAAMVSRSRAEGILEATKSGLYLRYVRAEGAATGRGAMMEGDIVVTSGRAGIFPAGVVIGRIRGEAGRSADGLHWEALVEPEFRYLAGDLVYFAEAPGAGGDAGGEEGR